MSSSYTRTRLLSKEKVCANPFCGRKFYVHCRNKQLKYCFNCRKNREYLKIYKSGY